ncbi:MAG TPA: tetratricopeptide repeat protein, partial [Chthoniobacteraceae bacterium]|nr:tetratricopeptide repeat protein [Chthoniobacteraceae bacterium]
MRALIFMLIASSVTSFASDATKQRLDRSIEFLEARLKSDPEDFTTANRLCDALLRRSRWTGRLEDWRRASEVASQSADSVDVNPGGAVVQAQIALAGHRFTEARELVLKLETLMPGKPLPFQLLGDALLELGDLDGAEKAYATMTEMAGSMVGTESRAARLAWMRGQIDEAQRHLSDSLSLAREPDATEDLAWALVQSGELAFRRGDFATAESHYAEALKVAPDYWAAIEHMAELRGAQGKDEEAVALFTKAAEMTGRPEIWQGLGDYHLFKRRPDEAKAGHEKALAGYRASIGKEETLYVHHLAGFYSDSQTDPAEAV